MADDMELKKLEPKPKNGAKRSASVSDSTRYTQNPTTRVTFDVGNAQKKISKFGFELVDGKISSLRDPRFDNFTKFLRTSSHDAILERLQDIHLGERCGGPGRGGLKSVFNAILDNAVNGDQIIIQKLDECVTSTVEDENHPKYSLRVNLEPLIDVASQDQVTAGFVYLNHIIRDMIDFKTPAAKQLLRHPVVEIFLDVKWKKVRKVFVANFVTYCIFLLSYSLFLGNIFYRQDDSRRLGNVKISDLGVEMGRIVFPVDAVREAKALALEKNQSEIFGNNTYKGHPPFHTCPLEGGPSMSCAFEVVLVITIIFLAISEFFQMIILGPFQYITEFENLLELTVIGLASSGLAYQEDTYTLKWLSALGICFAYLELIFLIGRYPLLGGSISLMFYTITLHLIKSLSNYLILIVGFAFSFFIMLHKGKDSDEVDHFENPWKAFVKTLVMAQGEYQFDDIYDSTKADPYSRAFTMVLMVGLVIWGSLVMVNLLIAIIVSDISNMRENGHLQALVNKAQHIVHVETLLKFCCCLAPSFKKRYEIEKCITVCPHSICRCTDSDRFDSDLVLRLKRIVRKRTIMKNVDALLSSSSSATNSDGQDAFSNVLKSVSRIMRQRSHLTTTGVNESEEGPGNNILHEIAEIIVHTNI